MMVYAIEIVTIMFSRVTALNLNLLSTACSSYEHTFFFMEKKTDTIVVIAVTLICIYFVMYSCRKNLTSWEDYLAITQLKQGNSFVD